MALGIGLQRGEKEGQKQWKLMDFEKNLAHSQGCIKMKMSENGSDLFLINTTCLWDSSKTHHNQKREYLMPLKIEKEKQTLLFLLFSVK